MSKHPWLLFRGSLANFKLWALAHTYADTDIPIHRHVAQEPHRPSSARTHIRVHTPTHRLHHMVVVGAGSTHRLAHTYRLAHTPTLSSQKHAWWCEDSVSSKPCVAALTRTLSKYKSWQSVSAITVAALGLSSRIAWMKFGQKLLCSPNHFTYEKVSLPFHIKT